MALFFRSIKLFFLQQYYNILARLARGYLKKHAPYIIGINGSIGKTIARNIIHQTLQKFLPDHYRVSTSGENFNGYLGFSLSVFEIESIRPSFASFTKVLRRCIAKRFRSSKHYDCIILEYGIDTPGEMKFLLDIARPDMGIFTKIDSVHSEQFGNPQAIAAEESLMIKATKDIALLNSDDTYARQLYDMIDIEKFLYTTTKEELNELHITPPIRYEDNKLYIDKSTIVASRMDIYTMNKKYRVSTNLFGKENYGYIAVAFAITEILLYRQNTNNSLKSFANKKKFHMQYELTPGRSQLFHGIAKSVIFDSTYNASPKSVRKIIETSYSIKKELYMDHGLLLVLGDMRELGDLTEEEHRRIAGVASIADKIILVGESIRYTQDELQKMGYNMSNVFHFRTSLQAKKQVLSIIHDDTSARFVMLKGSQNTIYLEELTKSLIDHRKHPYGIEKTHLCRQSDWRLAKKQAFFAKRK